METPHPGHSVTLDRVTHRFGEFVALQDISLEVPQGELLALLGPSGCGKSTLLRIVSGFIEQSQGRILFDGESVDHLAPNRRGAGIVFQNYALFPHMTVAENVAYGLEARRTAGEIVKRRVREMLALVHMEHLGERLPRQLSGGQQQRIALARALAVDPKILLLDEPFGALDKNLRLDMQIEVKRLQRQYGITTILVTHDQEEALSMADRVAVMNKGIIEQVSTPTEIYDRPSTLFVNQFVGHTNLLPGTLTVKDKTNAVVLDDGSVIGCHNDSSVAAESSVYLSVRPERFRLFRERVSESFPVTVRLAMPLGPHIVYEAETAIGIAVKISVPRSDGADTFAAGDNVHVSLASASSCNVFPRETTTRREHHEPRVN